MGEILLQAIITGLLMGGIYGLVTLGLSITFGVMQIMNFAQGDFLMLAMYATFFSVTFLHVDPYISIFIVLPLMFIIGAVLFRFLIIRIIPKHQMYQMLFMMGLQFFLQNLALSLFSPDYRFVQSVASGKFIQVGPAVIDITRFIAFVVSIIITIAVFVFLRSTDTGRAIRAASQDRDAAAFSGINVRKVFVLAFGIGVAITGVAGPLVAPIIPLQPLIGNSYLTFAMMAVVLGGLGNFYGALISGFILSVALEIGNAFLPGSLGPVLPFILFILVLLFKPEGIWGGKAR